MSLFGSMFSMFSWIIVIWLLNIEFYCVRFFAIILNMHFNDEFNALCIGAFFALFAPVHTSKERGKFCYPAPIFIPLSYQGGTTTSLVISSLWWNFNELPLQRDFVLTCKRCKWCDEIHTWMTLLCVNDRRWWQTTSKSPQNQSPVNNMKR